MAKKLFLRVIRGSTISFVMDTPFDLTNAVITSEVHNDNGNGTAIGTFDCVKQTVPNTSLLGRISFTLPHTQSNGLVAGAADQCFDVKIDLMDGPAITRRIRTSKIWLNVEDYGTA